MANIKSQKKRILTNEKARIKNVGFKSKIKTLTKKVLLFVKNSDKQSAFDALIVVNKKYDNGVSKGIFNKKTAANKKSKLSKLVNSLEGNIKKTPVKKQKTVKSKAPKSKKSAKVKSTKSAKAKVKSGSKISSSSKPNTNAKVKPKQK